MLAPYLAYPAPVSEIPETDALDIARRTACAVPNILRLAGEPRCGMPVMRP